MAIRGATIAHQNHRNDTLQRAARPLYFCACHLCSCLAHKEHGVYKNTNSQLSYTEMGICANLKTNL